RPVRSCSRSPLALRSHPAPMVSLTWVVVTQGNSDDTQGQLGALTTSLRRVGSAHLPRTQDGSLVLAYPNSGALPAAHEYERTDRRCGVPDRRDRMLKTR